MLRQGGILPPCFHFVGLISFFCEKLLTNKEECAIIVKHDLYAPVAQLVEHLTFNHRVRDSSSRRSTNRKEHPCGALFYWCPCVTRILLAHSANGIRNIATSFPVGSLSEVAKFPHKQKSPIIIRTFLIAIGNIFNEITPKSKAQKTIKRPRLLMKIELVNRFFKRGNQTINQPQRDPISKMHSDIGCHEWKIIIYDNFPCFRISLLHQSDIFHLGFPRKRYNSGYLVKKILTASI